MLGEIKEELLWTKHFFNTFFANSLFCQLSLLWKLFINPLKAEGLATPHDFLPLQGGQIIYFGESFIISMDMVNDFREILFNFYGLKKL